MLIFVQRVKSELTVIIFCLFFHISSTKPIVLLISFLIPVFQGWESHPQDLELPPDRNVPVRFRFFGNSGPVPKTGSRSCSDPVPFRFGCYRSGKTKIYLHLTIRDVRLLSFNFEQFACMNVKKQCWNFWNSWRKVQATALICLKFRC